MLSTFGLCVGHLQLALESSVQFICRIWLYCLFCLVSWVPYVVYIWILLDKWLATFFTVLYFFTVDHCFTLEIASFVIQSLLIWCNAFVDYVIISWAIGVLPRKILASVSTSIPCFPAADSCLVLRSFICLQLVFVQGKRWSSGLFYIQIFNFSDTVS